MSSEMVGWAFHQSIDSASRKLVLLAMADFAGQDGMTWATMDVLCAKTSLNRKTIISAIAELEESGYLEDSGERKGATNSIKVYRFIVEGHEESTLDKQFRKRSSSENGAVPKTDGSSTVFTTKQYQKRTEAVPKTVLKSYRDSKESLGSSIDAEDSACYDPEKPLPLVVQNFLRSKGKESQRWEQELRLELGLASLHGNPGSYMVAILKRWEREGLPARVAPQSNAAPPDAPLPPGARMLTLAELRAKRAAAEVANAPRGGSNAPQ